MKRLSCWWFGCNPDYEAMQHYCKYVPCKRCGAHDTPYADRVGDTRHNRAMGWLRYWLWRRWLPTKCPACGSRFEHRSDCDWIPF